MRSRDFERNFYYAPRAYFDGSQLKTITESVIGNVTVRLRRSNNKTARQERYVFGVQDIQIYSFVFKLFRDDWHVY